MKKTLLLLCCVTALCCLSACAEEASPLPDFSDRWADRFLSPGEPAQADEWTYRSENLYVEIRSFRYAESDIYAADIFVRGLGQLRRGFGGGKWGLKSQSLSVIAENERAVVALTGDNAHNLSQGAVYGNGALLRRTTNRKRELGLIGYDGVLRILNGAELTKQDILDLTDSVWQGFLFGPSLLDENGRAKTSFQSNVMPANPRAVIGYYEPGHYLLLLADGRGVKSLLESGKRCVGLKMGELAALCEELQLTQAYNLDGGQSAALWFRGRIVSNPYKGGRKIGDAVVVTDLP